MILTIDFTLFINKILTLSVSQNTKHAIILTYIILTLLTITIQRAILGGKGGGWQSVQFTSVAKRRSLGQRLIRDISTKHVDRTRLFAKRTKTNTLTLTITCIRCLYYHRHHNKSSYNRYPSYGRVTTLTRPSLRLIFPIGGRNGGSNRIVHDSRFLPLFHKLFTRHNNCFSTRS